MGVIKVQGEPVTVGRQRPGAAFQARAAAAREPSAEEIDTLIVWFNQRRYAEMETLARTLVLRFPEAGIAWKALGVALQEQWRNSEALPCLFKASSLLRQDAQVHYNLGNALRELGLHRQAQSSYQRALKIQPDFAQAHFNLSVALKDQGLLAEAELSHRRAMSIQPDYPDALVTAGEALAGAGQFESARRLFARALELEPRMPEAWAALATLRRMTAADTPWLETAQALVQGGLPPRQETRLRFAMGKFCDDLGDYARAFAHYRHANELKKAHGEHYVPRVQSQLVDQLIEAWTPEVLAGMRAGACDSQRPLFVVGMPRSGTSLIEQILASHPAVAGAGELPLWGDAVRQLQMAGASLAPDKSWRHALAGKCLCSLKSVSRDAVRVIDKMPANFHWLGLIHAVFPKARILHVQRQPLDTCLSIYFQNFNAAHRYANDLGDIAHYYREYHRLMAHWRALLPAGVMLEVPYDALVQDPPSWSRRMVEFSGLDWDARCLDFHKTERRVDTASKWQVRQPIYRTARERWRHYGNFLGPLCGLAELQPV